MFFRKKQKVDLDAKFKEVYHEVNKITADAGNELDVTIKYSQLKLACRKYDELIDLIHQGANFEERHFLSLKESRIAGIPQTGNDGFRSLPRFRDSVSGRLYE